MIILMHYQKNVINKQNTSITHNIKIVVFISLFAGLVLNSSPVFSGPTDDEFEGKVLDICILTNNPPNVDQFCQDINIGGLGGGNGDLVVNANLGIRGAQGRTANAVAENNRQTTSKRRDEIKNKNKLIKDNLFINLSIGASGHYTEQERAQTPLENGFDSDQHGSTALVDYRFSKNLIAGFAFNYLTNDVDFGNNAGKLEVESWGGTFYSYYTPIDSIAIDLRLGYTALDYESQRNAVFGDLSTNAKGDTDGDQFSVFAGMDYYWHYGEFGITPRGELEFVNTDIDSFSERGNTGLELDYGRQSIRSLKTRIGARFDYALSFPVGLVIKPFAQAFYVHEYKNESRNLPSTLLISSTVTVISRTDDPDRDYMVWGAGINGQLMNGLTMFVQYNQLTAHSFIKTWGVSGGLRLSF